MDPVPHTSKIGAQILEADISDDLENLLREIMSRIGDEQLRLICNVYSDISTGWRILHRVAAIGNVEICTFLITQLKASPNIQSYSGDTPLILAAKGDHLEVAHLLIKHDALVYQPNKKGFTALHYAAKQNSKELLDLLLQNFGPIDIESEEGTPLQCAASGGKFDALKFLIEKGAEKNYDTSSVIDIPIICAIKSCSKECINHLLKKRAVLTKFALGLTPLAYAAQQRDTKCLKLLLPYIENADTISLDGLTPIEHAAIVNNAEAVRTLLKLTKVFEDLDVEQMMKYIVSDDFKAKKKNLKTSCLNRTDISGREAMISGDFTIAAQLYSKANYLDPDNKKWTAMRSMCYLRGNMGVQALVDVEESIKQQGCPRPKYHHIWQLFKMYHRASMAFIVSPRDKEPETDELPSYALFKFFSWLYLTCRREDMMIFFQHFGKLIPAADANGERFEEIFEADANGNLEYLLTQLKDGAVIESRETPDILNECRLKGQNFLHREAEMGHLDNCKCLVDVCKVDIDALTDCGDTPLMLAVKKGHYEVVEYLIGKGAEVVVANYEGLTALHYAVLNFSSFQDKPTLMELLLSKGADINADSVNGTSLQCASSNGNVYAVNFLLNHGAKPNYWFLLWESPLVCAIKSRSIECLDALLKAKADPNRFNYGFNPLSYAAKEADAIYLQSLINADADPNANGIGFTRPIQDAASANNRECVEILFPRTDKLEGYEAWTVESIMHFHHLAAASQSPITAPQSLVLRMAIISQSDVRVQTEQTKNNLLDVLRNEGQTAIKKKKYRVAVTHFKAVQHLDPSNFRWPLTLSLCHAHTGRFLHAVLQFKECVRLYTDGPNDIAGEADAEATAQIFKKYFMAGLAFRLDPDKDETYKAFRLAAFNHFASTYLMNSQEAQDVIVSFSRE